MTSFSFEVGFARGQSRWGEAPLRDAPSSTSSTTPSPQVDLVDLFARGQSCWSIEPDSGLVLPAPVYSVTIQEQGSKGARGHPHPPFDNISHPTA